MSKERRHQEDEDRQILDQAIGPEGAPAQSLPTVGGLTLLQLQEVGREVGLPPDRITQAAAAFEGRGESVPRGKPSDYRYPSAVLWLSLAIHRTGNGSCSSQSYAQLLAGREK